ncbi:MAG: EpsG family protein [Proteiniphilum sp.]
MSKIGRILVGIITYLLIILICGKVSYTPDWSGYEFLLENNSRLEVFFKIISDFALKKGFTYEDVHLFYVSIYTIFLLWLISIFNKNLFVISFFYLFFVFLFYTTQIRFFMGYYAGILALYYFLHDRRLLLSLALFLFAILNHSSLIILLLYIPLFSINIHKLTKIVTIAAVAGVFFFFALNLFIPITTLINNDARFSAYLSIESRSSVLGGFASLLPFIIYIPFLSKYYFKVRNKLSLVEDINKIDFLYKLTIIPIAFTGLSIYIQIIGHRFIVPSLVISLMLYFKLRSYDNKNRILRNYFIAFLCFGVLYYYILLPYITSSHKNENIIRMLNSNQIIQNLLL